MTDHTTIVTYDYYNVLVALGNLLMQGEIPLEKLMRVYASLLWRFRVWKLKFQLAKLERTLGHKSEWILSYELCHMILSAIPRDMLIGVQRGFELNQEVELLCDNLAHYQKSLVYVIDVIRATILYRDNGRNYDATQLVLLKYGDYTQQNTIGMLFVESESIKSTIELYDWLDAQLTRLASLDRLKHLTDTDLSYLDRRAHAVLQDLFALCTTIAKVAIERDPPIYLINPTD